MLKQMVFKPVLSNKTVMYIELTKLVGVKFMQTSRHFFFKFISFFALLLMNCY